MVDLVSLFNHLAEKSDGQLRWDNKDRAWTRWMFQCFDDYMVPTYSAGGISEYMEIDRVWRDTNLDYITLGFEHENNFGREDFLTHEIQHLIDLKATYKVAITYPQLGEEEETAKEIGSLLNRSTWLRFIDYCTDEYLIVFGFATKKDGKLTILWKGYRMDYTGKLLDTYTRVVMQASG